MLILTSILGEVDYLSWYGELRRTARFSAPKFIDLKNHQLPRKYVFAFYNSQDVEEYSWDVMQYAFTHQVFSEQFTQEFPRACEAAKRHDFDVAMMKPIPIKFIVKPFKNNRRADQVAFVKNLTKTVLKIRELEAKPSSAKESKSTTSTRKTGAKKDNAGSISPPVFHLECMDLDFRSFSTHTTVIAEIKKLVETGVPVVSLTLPRRGTSHSKESDEKQRLVWASFFCTITGQPQAPPPTTVKTAAGCRPAQVQRIVLPPTYYPMNIFSTMLISALATSRGVKAVRFDDDAHLCKYGGIGKWKTWAWLAYALFNESAQSSVETLEFGQHQPTADEMTAFSKVIQSSDPLAALWQMVVAANASDASPDIHSVGKPVTVAKGTMLHPLVDSPFELAVALPNDWDGTLVRDERSSGSADVLLPGFGLYRVDRASIPNKRQRTPSTPPPPPLATTTRSAKITQLILGFRARKPPSYSLRSRHASEYEPTGRNSD